MTRYDDLEQTLADGMDRIASAADGSGLDRTVIGTMAARRARNARRRRVAAACATTVAVAAGLATFAGTRDDGGTVTSGPDVTVPTTPAPSTSEPSPASESTTTTRPTIPTPDTAPTDTAVAPPDEITAPELVPPRPVWAAYLAVADETDPTASAALAAASGRAEAAGHTIHTFALACQGTAAEALGVPPSTIGTAVLFDSEADARRFADTYDEPVLDVVHVVEYWCYAAVQ